MLGLISHPKTRHSFVFRVLWAFCVYLEAVSVLPQLVMMQKGKVGTGAERVWGGGSHAQLNGGMAALLD